MGVLANMVRFFPRLGQGVLHLEHFSSKAVDWSIGPLVPMGWEEDNPSQQIDEKKHKIFVFSKVRSRLGEGVYLVYFLKVGYWFFETGGHLMNYENCGWLDTF